MNFHIISRLNSNNFYLNLLSKKRRELQRKKKVTYIFELFGGTLKVITPPIQKNAHNFQLDLRGRARERKVLHSCL